MALQTYKLNCYKHTNVLFSTLDTPGVTITLIISILNHGKIEQKQMRLVVWSFHVHQKNQIMVDLMNKKFAFALCFSASAGL